MTRATGGLVRLAGGAALCIAVLAAVAPMLAPFPQSMSWEDLDRWYGDAGPGLSAVTGLWAFAILGAVWILLSALLQSVVSRERRVARVVDALSPRLVREIARGMTSASFVAGLALPATTAMAIGPPPGTAEMVPLGELDPATEPGASTTDAPSSTTTSTVPPTVEPPPVVPVFAPPRTTEHTGGEVVVVRGDSFWSIAADALVDAGTPDPSDAAVDGYWRRLIDANRTRLVDPDNPDLIYPGQSVVLPDPLA
jgi:nucleoid-associated protein YgaU